ncbi:MAG: tetraacyldisaccharide 4'-kinase [Betaproteobacteria bacterium]|nr:tetraacyldisaccharide 4'-kinase [Betaproteobacteria bacterium]
MDLKQWIEDGWPQRGLRSALLLPIALLFVLAVNLRRLAYRQGWLASIKLPVPVVVVGNITAGGSGKTPLVLYLVLELSKRGWRPGIVSRGYGGTAQGVHAVSPACDATLVGDEPLLLSRRAGCPVFVGRDRVAAAQALLSAHPDCNVLIADDGLQHARLVRGVEIVVIDERGIGNGWPLPAGPLRECPTRITEAHALVLNGDASVPKGAQARQVFSMHLVGDRLRNLHDPLRTCGAEALRGRRLHALAGIGHPARFFRQLERMGLQVETHAFPDHHVFRRSDLAFSECEALLMTEKDAVKCQAFAPPETWVLPVEAQLDPDLAQWLVEKLNGCQAS